MHDVFCLFVCFLFLFFLFFVVFFFFCILSKSISTDISFRVFSLETMSFWMKCQAYLSCICNYKKKKKKKDICKQFWTFAVYICPKTFLKSFSLLLKQSTCVPLK